MIFLETCDTIPSALCRLPTSPQNGENAMLETVKEHIWELLQEKDISLAMIYNKKGEILWHRGRTIRGKNVHQGEGFCKTYIHKSLHTTAADTTHGNNALAWWNDDLSESAKKLLIKSVSIHPVDSDFFLYIDSGTRHTFSDAECLLFKMLGKMMGSTIRQIRECKNDVSGITGSSEEIKNIKELVLKYSLEEEPVLLLGETGVGKSHIAELIHRYSGRKGQFVVADVTTVNENLFESYIFGHRRGSFTSAVCDKKGLIDEAHMGTLFFDEIAEVPAFSQAKLLRFIETRKYRVLGETAEREANVRIITATNRDLTNTNENNGVREDLYFRLNVLQIKIPPLRDRKADLEAIVREKINYLKGKEMGDGFWEALAGYHWPGNFRELFNVLKRAGILCDSPITGRDIRAIIDENMTRTEQGVKESAVDNTWKAIKAGNSFWKAVKTPFLERDLNRSQVRRIVSRALVEAGGKYVDTLPILHIEPGEYKKFMKFLHKNRLQ